MGGKKKTSYMRVIYLQFLTVLVIAAVCINVIFIGYYTYRERKLIRDEKVNPRSQNPKGFPRVYCILSSSAEADRSFSTADFSHKKQPSGTVC